MKASNVFLGYIVIYFGGELHIIPENDCRPHLLSNDCDCGCRLDTPGDGIRYRHNSFDGRELLEHYLSVIQ